MGNIKFIELDVCVCVCVCVEDTNLATSTEIMFQLKIRFCAKRSMRECIISDCLLITW